MQVMSNATWHFLYIFGDALNDHELCQLFFVLSVVYLGFKLKELNKRGSFDKMHL